jgi:hypothetical protein
VVQGLGSQNFIGIWGVVGGENDPSVGFGIQGSKSKPKVIQIGAHIGQVSTRDYLMLTRTFAPQVGRVEQMETLNAREKRTQAEEKGGKKSAGSKVRIVSLALSKMSATRPHQ